MHWTDLVRNPRVVLAYYSEPPALDPLDLHAVRLHRDGPTLEVVGDLPSFPDRPSPRWNSAANTAQVVLRFLGLRDFSMTGWAVRVPGELEILPSQPDGVRFAFHGTPVRFEGSADWLDIPHISGYVDSSRPPAADDPRSPPGRGR